MTLVKADLHTHQRSGCRFKPHEFDKMVSTAAKRLGPGAIIAMTNYEDYIGEGGRYEKMLEFGRGKVRDLGIAFYDPRRDVLVIKGSEVETVVRQANGEMAKAHLLALAIPTGMDPKFHRPFKDALTEIEDMGGLKIADHPFHYEGCGPYLQQHPELLERLDGLEAFNGEASVWLPTMTQRGANRRAQQFFDQVRADHPNLARLVTSDSHSYYELGSSWMLMPELDRSSEDTLRESLKNSLITATKEDMLTRRNSLVGIMGAVDHILDYVVISTLAKRGIKL